MSGEELASALGVSSRTVRTYVGHAGRSSVPTHVEMRLVGDERIHAEGAAKVVWMDTQTGKSVPLPDHVRALIEAE